MECGLEPEELSAFHADLKPEQRQEIQEKVKAGEIRVVFTTNALEIGLEVGGLDGVILAGFPSKHNVGVAADWASWARLGQGRFCSLLCDERPH